jgi:hypothetical protein
MKLPGAAGGGMTLARRYEPGESTVYQTETRTRIAIRTSPAGLEAFLPLLPTGINTRQQNTLTVRTVHGDGVADVENHFDQFAMDYNLPEKTPEELRTSSMQQQQAFCRQLRGQTLVAHYDHEGRLLRFEGSEPMLQLVSAPLRPPLEQVLRFFLEQMGGASFYPARPVKVNEEWKRSTSARATDAFPWGIESESVYRYSGETTYNGMKAAVIEFHFTDVLTPALQRLNLPGAAAELSQPANEGNRLHVEIRGEGKGRMLAAIEGGRILENQASIRQTLNASLRSLPGTAEGSNPLNVEINAETTLQMGAGRGPQRR